MKEQALALSQPQPTLVLPQIQPTLPTLSELAMRFWKELLQGDTTANDEGYVGGGGSRWM